MMVVDRNPSASTRCRVLIERWMYNVNYVLRNRYPEIQRHEEDDSLDYTSWWRPGCHTHLTIGEFVGQGRVLRYSGIANGMLELTASWTAYGIDSDYTEIESHYRSKVVGFRKNRLIVRPTTWWFIWIAAQFGVSVSASMAFMVSFNTPTVGLGCRSFLDMLWWIFSSISWISLAIFQEPPRITRYITGFFNFCSVVVLNFIMFFQVSIFCVLPTQKGMSLISVLNR